MPALKRILALGLLFLYGGVVMHGILPHSHEHESGPDKGHSAHNHSGHGHDHAHHHQHEHHHSHSHEKVDSGDWFSVLLNLLGDFNHQDLGDGHFEWFLAEENSQNLSGVDTQINQEVADISCFHRAGDEFDCDFISGLDPPPRLHDPPHIVNASLRGPPSLS